MTIRTIEERTPTVERKPDFTVPTLMPPQPHLYALRKILDDAISELRFAEVASIIEQLAHFSRSRKEFVITPMDKLVDDVRYSLAAYEEILRIRHKGKALRAQRTRNSLNKNGVVETLDYVTVRPVSKGFTDLCGIGLPHLIFEQLVLKHAGLFRPMTVKSAVERMQFHGLL